MRIRRIAAGWAVLAVSCTGCATFTDAMPSIYLPSPMTTWERPVTPNPLVVPGDDFELVWNEVVKVLDEYFDIDKENRLAGTILTQPRVAATIFEPWNGDSVTFYDRVESSLQTIRRFAQVSIKSAPEGGFAVKIEVYKQLEDLTKPDRQSGSRAVFNNQFPVNRTREIVGPIPIPLQWIPRGRDHDLEQVILARIRQDLAL